MVLKWYEVEGNVTKWRIRTGLLTEKEAQDMPEASPGTGLEVCIGRQVVVMYMGEYNHTLDAKGRLIIPSKFRETLGDKFVVTKGMDGCLFVYDYAGWTGVGEKIRGLSLNKRDHRVFVRLFLASATEVEVDKQGRILIPSKLREKANITRDVTLVGTGNHIEIWDSGRWAQEEEQEGAMEDIAEGLDIMDFGF